MVKRLTRHGNSLALVIDRPVLELLKFDAETDLEISTDGKGLHVYPAPNPERRKKFANALAYTHRRYGRMLKRLADK